MFTKCVQNTDTEFTESVVPCQNAGPTPPLLTWKVAQKKLPWGIVLLLGGGFALAKGSDVSSSGSPNVKGERYQEPTSWYEYYCLCRWMCVSCFRTRYI